MIQSNLKTAEKIATEMEKAREANERAINKTLQSANKTTVTVNLKAQEANQEAVKLVRHYNQSFQQTIEKIHSVAKEFERMDKELDDSINQLMPINEALQDLYTYKNAKNG